MSKGDIKNLLKDYSRSPSLLPEGDIGDCGIAVLDNFSCGISVIVILIAVLRYCGILQTSGMRFCGILDGIKNSPSSPPTFSEPFPVSDRFISC